MGLGLVVSTDGAVLLVSHAYAGDKPDVTQFPGVISELVKRFGALAATTGDLTVVYDAGQESQDNQVAGSWYQLAAPTLSQQC